MNVLKSNIDTQYENGLIGMITQFDSATQECFDIDKGNSLTLGYIADDIADHPMFKYVGEKPTMGYMLSIVTH